MVTETIPEQAILSYYVYRSLSPSMGVMNLLPPVHVVQEHINAWHSHACDDTRPSLGPKSYTLSATLTEQYPLLLPPDWAPFCPAILAYAFGKVQVRPQLGMIASLWVPSLAPKP